MELLELNEASRAQFNHFVAAHDNGDFLQSWDWGSWQERLGRKVHRFTVSDNRNTLLTAQMIQMTIPRTNQHYLYIPHGPLVLNNTINEATAKTVNFFMTEITKRFSQALFLRIEPTQNYLDLLTTN